MALAVLVFAPGRADAASLRCPDAETAFGSPGQPQETVRIAMLWKMLHGPGLDGGDGPLGCPVGTDTDFSDPAYTFRGVGHQFQRGWIYVPVSGSSGPEMAVVKGLGTWTVWTTGTDGILWNPASKTAKARLRTVPGEPAFGGAVTTFQDTDDNLSLVRCDATDPLGLTGCTAVVPNIAISNGPFDFAARLDIRLLSTPDQAGRSARVAAMLVDWLPCYTRLPTDDAVPDEDTAAHANVMLRRGDACPLTGIVPKEVARAWLAALAVPRNQYPGTSFDEDTEAGITICSARAGELDVLLTQLVSLRFRFLGDLAGAPLAGLDAALAPWGGPPRRSPYIEPYGLCAGYQVIETENHILLQEASRYLINTASGAANQANRDWLVRFMQQLARRDLYEYNALPYTRYQTKALYALADFAPDSDVRTAATGILDWIFAKLALSGNMDRENRPYRRRPDDNILAEKAWWSSAMSPAAVAAALFVGPLQHMWASPDLSLDTAGSKKAVADVIGHPGLGAAGDYFAASLVDAASTGYGLPRALATWFERRFTDDAANRLTYLQALRHHSLQQNDPALFLQEPSGAEIVSGNRNWTMVGGGAYAIPGYLPTPPSANSGIIDAVADAKAGKTQLDHLWSDQAGIFRETMMITSPVAGSRQQTVRFGRSEPSSRDRNGQQNRLCVAEGFMCGFDLRMPDRPFPSSDELDCPVKTPLPAALVSAFQKYDGTGLSVVNRLGCLVKRPGIVTPYNWTVWTFEHGMLALPLSQTPDAFLGAWVQGRVNGSGGQLRVVWNSSWWADWFRIHVYNRSVAADGGEPPGGWIEPLAVSGDAGDRTKDNHGDVVYNLTGLGPDVSWDVLVVGCQKEYAFGVLTGHDCQDNVLPKLSVSVGADPQQPFACRVYPPPSPPLQFVRKPTEAVVLEVGSCVPDSPYGLFVYIWSQSCPRHSLFSVDLSVCPMNANDYGFVVAAPSRGWTGDEFRALVDNSMRTWLGQGHRYEEGSPASIDVPLSPPTVRMGDKWAATAPPSSHSVSFQWSSRDAGSVILGDTAAPGLFGPGSLAADPEQWPTAASHVTAPDVPTAAGPLLTSAGTGCFSLAGLPTPDDRDPAGLLVDLRDPRAPSITEPRTSQLAGRCP